LRRGRARAERRSRRLVVDRYGATAVAAACGRSMRRDCGRGAMGPWSGASAAAGASWRRACASADGSVAAARDARRRGCVRRHKRVPGSSPPPARQWCALPCAKTSCNHYRLYKLWRVLRGSEGTVWCGTQGGRLEEVGIK